MKVGVRFLFSKKLSRSSTSNSPSPCTFQCNSWWFLIYFKKPLNCVLYQGHHHLLCQEHGQCSAVFHKPLATKGTHYMKSFLPPPIHCSSSSIWFLFDGTLLWDSSTSSTWPSSNPSKQSDFAGCTMSNETETHMLSYWINRGNAILRPWLLCPSTHTSIAHCFLCVSSYQLAIPDDECPSKVFDHHLVIFSFLNGPVEHFPSIISGECGRHPWSIGSIRGFYITGNELWASSVFNTQWVFYQ